MNSFLLSCNNAKCDTRRGRMDKQSTLIYDCGFVKIHLLIKCTVCVSVCVH